MMQESSHIPVLAHQSWPVKSAQSGVTGTGTGSAANNVKRPDAMNGLHKDTQLRTLPAAPIRVDNETLNAEKQTKVRWTVKNLTKKDDGKLISSNINSWLSSQKVDDKSSPFKSSTTSAHTSSGFDLAKLYPELSSKLGLIKNTSQNDTSPKASSTKTSLNGSRGSGSCRPRSPDSPNELETKYKSVGVKAINPNLFTKSSLLYDSKCSGGSVAKNRTYSLSSEVRKNFANKPKEKLDLTKLSEDKLRKLISSQALNNKVVTPTSQYSLDCKPSRHTASPSHRSKVTTVSLYDVVCNKTIPLIRGATYPPAPPKPNKITLLPRQPPHSLPNHKTLSHLQLRVHNLYQDHYAYKYNLFPLGYESSESDSSDDDFGVGMDSVTLDCSRLRSYEEDEVEEEANPPSLSNNLQMLLQTQKREVVSARDRLVLQERGMKHRWALTRALLEAARSQPSVAAATVSHFVNRLHSVLPSKKKNSKTKSSLLVPRHCVYEGDNARACGQKALPGTRHCVRHITYNVDQQLFSQCAAKKENNSLCRIPTFHLQNDFPLCQQHANHSMEATRLIPESPSKPKRARKKSKMPILCRYGKRNKKRRRSSLGSSSIVPSTSVRPSINSPGVCLGSPHSTSPLTPHTSPTFSTPCSDPAGAADDSELEDELEGMVGGLPLEARDIQDVLNKIPEHEFSQILYGSDGKLCDGSEEEDRKAARGTPAPLAPMCLDEGALGELISSSFNQQELNAISQVLSNMVGEGALDLGGDFDPNTGATATFQEPPEPPTPPVYLSEDSNSGSVQSPTQGIIPLPTGATNSLLHPNSKLKVEPTL